MGLNLLRKTAVLCRNRKCERLRWRWVPSNSHNLRVSQPISMHDSLLERLFYRISNELQENNDMIGFELMRMDTNYHISNFERVSESNSSKTADPLNLEPNLTLRTKVPLEFHMFNLSSIRIWGDNSNIQQYALPYPPMYVYIQL